jgi:hypothetical protein
VQPQVRPVLQDGVEDGGDHRRVALTLAERSHAHPGAVTDAVAVGLEVTTVVVGPSALQHGQQMHASCAGVLDRVEPVQGQGLMPGDAEARGLQRQQLAHVVLGRCGDETCRRVAADHRRIGLGALAEPALQGDRGKGAGIQQPGLVTPNKRDLASAVA